MCKSSGYGIICIYLTKLTDHVLEIEVILVITCCISSILIHVNNVMILHSIIALMGNKSCNQINVVTYN